MKVQEFKPDLMTSAGGKMLAAFFIAMKIEPSLAGVIKATGNDPEAVFAAINEAVEKAPHIMANVEELLTRFREMNAQHARIEAKLDRLLGEFGVTPNDALQEAGLPPLVVKPADAQLVTQAALDEASGRS